MTYNREDYFPLSEDSAIRKLMIPDTARDSQVDLEQLEKNIQRYIKVREYMTQPVTGEWLEELGFIKVDWTDCWVYQGLIYWKENTLRLAVILLRTPAETRLQVLHVLDLFNIPYNKPEIQ